MKNSKYTQKFLNWRKNISQVVLSMFHEKNSKGEIKFNKHNINVKITIILFYNTYVQIQFKLFYMFFPLIYDFFYNKMLNFIILYLCN
jgi:hypothetical protein